MRKAAFLYSEGLSRRSNKEKELPPPTRLQYTYELLMSYHAFAPPDSMVVEPETADEASLLTFHTGEYVAAVRSFSNGEKTYNPARFNFSDFGDNQIYPGMYEFVALSVGASLQAAKMVSSGEFDVAFNCSGGLHHAAPDYASGFCVFNDIVVAINYLLAQGLRVVYIDIDAHHGDGVQDAFYATDRVLTISIHESGMHLFPGTGDVSEVGKGAGTGFSVNVPLALFTDDETYLWAFDQVVPRLVDAFEPDIVVSQLGSDTHYLDPLTHLCLTSEGYTGLISRIRQIAPRWVAVGGGGYETSVVLRLWALAYGIMAGKDWPDEIPQDFRERYGVTRLRDTEKPKLDDSMRARARRFARESVAGVQKLVFPHHRL